MGAKVRLDLIEKLAKALEPDDAAKRATLEVLLYGFSQAIIEEAIGRANETIDARVYGSALRRD